jgi:calcium/calmodulin-dependent protein kinase (CaM kinase) II
MSLPSQDTLVAEVLAANQKLLESIAAADWSAYASLCEAEITCFEPEARGELVGGLAFHKFYFDLGKSSSPRHTTMCAPQVHLTGDMAVICYVRLTQSLDAAGHPQTGRCEETRVWRRVGDQWRHVHFHRSANG